MARIPWLAVLILVLPVAHAHHSSVGIYGQDMVEIEGVVTTVRWSNPHASYTVAVEGADGKTVNWHVETGSVSTLRLRGLDRDFIQVGGHVHLAGLSSLRGLPEMFAQNMLLDNGQELLLRAVAKPYWPAGQSGNLYRASVDEAKAAEGRRTAHGIYRVWAPVVENPEAYPLYDEKNIGPLTPAATAIKAAWEPRKSPLLGCGPKGMPHIMGSAYGIEFQARGDSILLRLEEFDTERLIHMGQPPASWPESYSRLGTSWGHWDGDTLVVETAGIDAPYFFGDGTPQSKAMRLTEYFKMNAAEDRLDYKLVVNDPETFTEPLEYTRFWIWRPDVRIQPYDCQR